MTKQYSIGEIAELCSISKKQLRYYDENGILSPRVRNQETRYRYYTEDQIEEILLLQELKALSFPLDAIGRMLADRRLDLLHLELENRLYQLREEIDGIRRQYDHSMDILLRISKGLAARQSATTRSEIRLVGVPRRVVIRTRYVSPWNANSLFIARRAELFTLAEEHGIHTGGPNMAIFHSGYMKQFSDSPEDREGDLEVCLNVMGHNPVGRAPGGAEILSPASPHCRVLGPFQAVSCVRGGHYAGLRPAYTELEAWARERDIALSGVSLEEYLIGATMTNTPDDYMTRIYLPLADSTV